MPIPPDCVKVAIVWDTGAPEMAVNTVHFKHLHDPGNTLDWAGNMTQRYANLVRDGLNTQWPFLKAGFYQGVKIVRFDAYHLDESGHTIDKATALPEVADQFAGTAAGGMLPLEVSIAVTLLGYPDGSFTQRSATKRGRIYLPGIAQSACNASGRVNNVQGTFGAPLARAFSYMQNRVMDAAPPHERAQLVILSKTAGTATPVQAVRVDDLFDVQRRRQNQLVPARAANPVTSQS